MLEGKICVEKALVSSVLDFASHHLYMKEVCVGLYLRELKYDSTMCWMLGTLVRQDFGELELVHLIN